MEISSDIVEGWERAILTYARLPRGTKRPTNDRQKLLQCVQAQRSEMRRLWRTFTMERGDLKRQLILSPKAAAGYMVGFHLPNTARCSLALSRVAQDSAWPRLSDRFAGLEIHDLGCGTGAMSVGFLSVIARNFAKTECHLVDQNSHLLTIAESMIRTAQDGCRIRRHRVGIENYAPRLKAQLSTDLRVWLLGYCWNELAANPRARRELLLQWSRAMEAGQSSLIALVEPSNQGIARRMMGLREQLVELGYRPLYPCPASQPCPMLKRSRDWCYSEMTWTRPSLQREVDRIMGVDREHLSSSVYVLASPDVAEGFARYRSPIVGRPKDKSDRRRFSYLVCQGHRLLQQRATDSRAIDRGLPVESMKSVARKTLSH